jgi:hypothetical protein
MPGRESRLDLDFCIKLIFIYVFGAAIPFIVWAVNPTERWRAHPSESTSVAEHSVVVQIPPPDPIREASIDPRILVRVAEAQRIVAETPRVREMWQWERVRSVVAEMGDALPVRIATLGEALEDNFIANYSPRSRTVTVSPIFAHYSAEHAASVLVHEATHAVFESLYDERLADATEEGREAFHERCGNYFLAEYMASEAVARLNEARWLYRNESVDRLLTHRRLLVQEYNDHGIALDALFAAETEHLSHDSRRAVRRDLGCYLQRISRNRHVGAGSGSCVDVVYRRGDAANEPFHPADLHPSFLHPLFRQSFIDCP